MKHKILFVPECYGDTLIVELLLRSLAIFSHLKITEVVNHQKGINKVGAAMKSVGQRKDKLAIGIVDNDKKITHSYIKEFIDITPVNNENSNLQLKKHPTHNQFLIVLNPAFDQWLLNCAAAVAVNPIDYHLNVLDVNAFKSITKDVNLKSNQNFVTFVKELKRKESNPMMTLQNWLKLIAEGNVPG